MTDARIGLVRLTEVPLDAVVALLNEPRNTRHMPLSNPFTPETAREWVQVKDAQWDEHGYGPWAVLVDGDVAGWGGFQREPNGADFALVLFPRHWGRGAAITRDVLGRGFAELGEPALQYLSGDRGAPTPVVREEHQREVGAVRLALEAAPAREVPVHQHRPRAVAVLRPLTVLGLHPLPGALRRDGVGQRHVSRVARLVEQRDHRVERALRQTNQVDPHIRHEPGMVAGITAAACAG